MLENFLLGPLSEKKTNCVCAINTFVHRTTYELDFDRCVLLLLNAKLHVELVEEVIIEEMSVLF